MNNNHIPFNKLSDLCDDAILSASEKQMMIDHIGRCGQCAAEMERLRSMLKLVSRYREVCIADPGFSQAIMRSIKNKNRPSTVGFYSYYRIAAIAAGIVLAIGFLLFNNTHVTDTHIAGNDAVSRSVSDKSVGTDRFRHMASHLERYDALIQNVSNSHIEGLIRLTDYKRLVKDMGPADSLSGAPAHYTSSPGPSMVNFDSESAEDIDFPLENEMVRFRIRY